MEKLAACKMIIARSQMCTKIFIGLDLVLQVVSLDFSEIGAFVPSCVGESLTENNQSKAQSNLSCRGSDRCQIPNFGSFVVG
jgi:hypothetical protein